jgi:hypothetical protein
MIIKLRVFLQQPFPFEISIRQIVLSLIGVGLFVSLFLVIFQPFGSGEYIREGRTWILWGYGFVTSLVLFFDMLLLPRIFPRIFNETKWNVIRGICFQFWHIISIGTANILYSNSIAGKEISVFAVLGFFLQTLSIGFFPITISVVSIHYYLLKKYVDSTKKINERIDLFENQREEAAEKPQKIGITSETGKEKIEINLKDLLFIKSIDNYVEVYRADRDNIEIILLRSSLKRIEENLKSYPFLFRCHRTYLINVNNISKVTGNSQGYKLIFKGVEYSIPVSRSYSKILLKLIV